MEAPTTKIRMDGPTVLDNERYARIEADISHILRDISELRSELKAGFRNIRQWILACLGTAVAVAALQAGWLQKNLDANLASFQAQNAATQAQIAATQALIAGNRAETQAQIAEFRRDSDRNYGLAMKALERSMQGPAEPAKTK
jgi:hypothetical protein